jgi:NitT/TauT family transport system substrate-binding protein
MRRLPGPSPLVVLLVLAFGLAACTAGASPSAPTPAASVTSPTSQASEPGAPSSGASAVASGPASAAPSRRAGPPQGQDSEFTVAETAVGIGSVAFRAAIDSLREQGYKIETPELAESELVSQGVAAGQFQFGSGANNSALLAMEKGGKMKFIIDRNSNEWTVVTTQAVEDCAGLVKSRVAIHSPGSVSGAMLRDWVKKTCPDVADQYKPLIIAGSQNRAAALQADQIDAAPAELRDWIVLKETAGDKFKVLVNFSEDLPDLHPTSMYGNTDWMEANPDVVKDLVREILLQHRRINDEEGYLMSLYQKYLPDEAKEPTAADVVKEYVDRGLFDTNGGLTEEAVDYTAKFFGPNGTGDLKADMPADQVSDLSYLEDVLAEIGQG